MKIDDSGSGLSVGDFLLTCHAYLGLTVGTPTLVTWCTTRWSVFLYELKRHEAAPRCLKTLQFDWDGPKPISPRAKELLEVLCIACPIQPDNVFRLVDRGTARSYSSGKYRNRYRWFVEQSFGGAFPFVLGQGLGEAQIEAKVFA